jgi:hypothetical protein
MPYQCDLGPGQTIYLDNPGPITLITLASGGPGQQQQATTQVQTGAWLEMPQVVRGRAGLLIRCVAAQGTFVWQIQGHQIGAVAATQWPEGETLPLTLNVVSPNPMTPMTPMAPLPPLKMGDMEMSANPMTMRMGNMQLSMDNAASNTASAPSASAKFCTQCGAAIAPSDRFCGSCGHQLQ